MTVHDAKEFLFWCLVLNYALLLYWAAIFLFARNAFYRLMTRWYRLSAEQFDALNFAGMALYKLGIILFNLVPWVALCLIR